MTTATKTKPPRSSADRDKLISLSVGLVDNIKHRTPGAQLEDWLNRTYPPGDRLFDGLARLVTAGVEDGWAANQEVGGAHYRRSLILEPCKKMAYFSITAVYMSSMERFRGAYHLHPYGEVNLVIPLNKGAELAGPRGWCGGGWTAPAPGSHHYPEVRGGALIALFYLPAGRISYDIQAPDAL